MQSYSNGRTPKVQTRKRIPKAQYQPPERGSREDMRLRRKAREQWLADTARDLTNKGYIVIPSHDAVPRVKWEDLSESWPLDAPEWKRANMVTLIARDCVLMDYDGNKDGATTWTPAQFLRACGMPADSQPVQWNSEGDSLHWLAYMGFPEGCTANKVKLAGNDLMRGNSLMHIKPGKKHNIPDVEDLPEAPQKLMEHFRKVPREATSAHVPPPVEWDGTHYPYAASALTHACHTLWKTHTDRNNTLNNEALGVFKLVAGGALDHDEAYNALFEASQIDDDTEKHATLASARTAGYREPRNGKGERLTLNAAEAPDSADERIIKYLESIGATRNGDGWILAANEGVEFHVVKSSGTWCASSAYGTLRAHGLSKLDNMITSYNNPEPKENPEAELPESDLIGQPVIENLMDVGTHGVLAGAPNAGKTTNMVYLATCVAAGIKAYGQFRVKNTGQKVVYIDLEGGGEVQAMKRANEIMHLNGEELGPDKFEIITDAPTIGNKQDIKDFCQYLMDKNKDHPVRLIIIDTLAVWMAGGTNGLGQPLTENDNGAMTLAADTMRTIARAVGCAVMTLHHPAKSDPKSMRGGSGLLGSISLGMSLELPNVTDRSRMNLIIQKKRGSGVKTGSVYGLRSVSVDIISGDELVMKREERDDFFGDQRNGVKAPGGELQPCTVAVNDFSTAAAMSAEIGEAHAVVSGVKARNEQRSDAKNARLSKVMDVVLTASQPMTLDEIAKGYTEALPDDEYGDEAKIRKQLDKDVRELIDDRLIMRVPDHQPANSTRKAGKPPTYYWHTKVRE